MPHVHRKRMETEQGLNNPARRRPGCPVFDTATSFRYSQHRALPLTVTAPASTDAPMIELPGCRLHSAFERLRRLRPHCFASFCALVLLVLSVFYPAGESESGAASNGWYVNSVYGITLRTPEDWRRVEQPPEAFAAFLEPDESRMSIALFQREKTGGLILLKGDLLPLDVSRVDWDSLHGWYEAYFRDKSRRQESAPGVSDYTYTVYPLDACASLCILSRERYGRALGERRTLVEARSYVYQCGREAACLVDIVLISGEDTFSRNYGAFVEIAGSLRRSENGDTP